jgi:very-long-chain (3R)-3-hydroxyacyl-CoA dehydratase
MLPLRVPSTDHLERYNAFFILYPLGIGSECMLVWHASHIAQPPEQYVWWAVLAAYVPGSYVLYTHMMRQRRRMIKGKGKAAPAGGKSR